MKTKPNLTFIILLISVGTFAQGKFYIVPHIGFYSGAFRGVDSVNSKQDLIKTKPFLGKDFSIGIKLEYHRNKLGFELGIESGFYSTGFYHNEGKNIPRVDSKESSSQGEIWMYTTDAKYNLLGFNINKPRKWVTQKTEKPYLLVTRFFPYLGLEIRRLGKSFRQDNVEYNSSIGTYPFGDIPGSRYYHSYARHHFSMRSGFDWVFYDGEKRRFILTFLYQFAFKDAGYWRYHFIKQNERIDFYYQNTTKGNGFTIKAGMPIKIFEYKTRNK